MATVDISRHWPGEECLIVSVTVDESFPDAVAECKQQALNAYAGALEITLADDSEAGE